MANICEGSERRTDGELRHFLANARVLSAELQGWYEMSVAMDLIAQDRASVVIEKIDRLGRSLSHFIERLAGGT